MKKESKEIIVATLIKNDTAVSTDDGDFVFKEIRSAFESGMPVNLDFGNIHLLTTAFLNAAIGQLYSIYDSNFLNQNLKLANVAEEDKILFLKVVERAKEYFLDKKGFEDSASNALYGSK